MKRSRNQTSQAGQGEFSFDANAEPFSTISHPLTDYFAEVAKVWGVPVGEKVRIRLSDSNAPELKGRLELAKMPDSPLNAADPLQLRVSGVYFAHREISEWSLEE